MPNDWVISPIVVSAELFEFVASVISVAAIPIVLLIVWVFPELSIPITEILLLSNNPTWCPVPLPMSNTLLWLVGVVLFIISPIS